MPTLKMKSARLEMANHLCRWSASYKRSPRFSIFSAGIFFAGVGIGGFLCPPSLGVSLLKALLQSAVADRRYRRPSNVKKVLGNTHDIFQVEQPPQHHLDRQRRHAQQQE